MADVDEWFKVYLRASRALLARPHDPEELEAAAEALRKVADELLQLALAADRIAWSLRQARKPS